MSLSATAKWVLLALLGLAIAIAIAIAAANLTSRQIGIASESVSAGDALAPALNVRPEGEPRGTGDGPRTTTTEEPPPPEETTVPDDHGGGDSDGDDD
ncbi:MAG: hypothetical protein E6G51_04205 [Actinobacteria bacterium]|nr:MAG: hypothetical protein E6G51_04205 [Actinomycetota bacterium]